MRWTGLWTGIVVSESLSDQTLINQLRVTDARIDSGRHRYWVAAEPAAVDLVGRHLLPGPWYAYFWRGERMLVLFHDARFDVAVHDSSTWGALLAFATARGIPAPELTFPTTEPTPEPPAPSADTGPVSSPPPGGYFLDLVAQQPAPDTPALVLADEDVDSLLDTVEEDLLLPLTRKSAAPRADAEAALAALHRIREVLDRPGQPRVLAPNGRWVHAGLRLAALPAVDLETLRALLLTLSATLLDPPHPLPELRPLTGALARLLAVLDLPPDRDTQLLTQTLRTAAGDTTLTLDQERAYQRLAHRVTMLLTESDPLHRFLLTPDS